MLYVVYGCAPHAAPVRVTVRTRFDVLSPQLCILSRPSRKEKWMKILFAITFMLQVSLAGCNAASDLQPPGTALAGKGSPVGVGRSPTSYTVTDLGTLGGDVGAQNQRPLTHEFSHAIHE